MRKTLDECYEILGLDSSASEVDVKTAYKQLALKCHPDKNPDDPEATKKFQELGCAYKRITSGENEDEECDEDEFTYEDIFNLFCFVFKQDLIALHQQQRDRYGAAAVHNDDNLDSDFVVKLTSDYQEEPLTEEEMTKFTTFASLNEQKEANKRKFCPDGKNQGTTKQGQKTSKPKSKSNKQLRTEHWKREQELSKVAAEIERKKKLELEKEALRASGQTKDVEEEKETNSEAINNMPYSSWNGMENISEGRQGHVGGQGNVKTKKSKVKKKKKQMKKEELYKERITEQEGCYSSEVETTTLPVDTTCYQNDHALPSDYSQNVKDTTIRTQTRVQERQSHPCESSVNLSTTRVQNQWPKPHSTSPNFWHRRQEQHDFLTELQPVNETEEERQLKMAIEMSKRQAEIEAVQREVHVLESELDDRVKGERGCDMGDTYSPASVATKTSVDETLMSKHELDVSVGERASSYMGDTHSPASVATKTSVDETLMSKHELDVSVGERASSYMGDTYSPASVATKTSVDETLMSKHELEVSIGERASLHMGDTYSPASVATKTSVDETLMSKHEVKVSIGEEALKNTSDHAPNHTGSSPPTDSATKNIGNSERKVRSSSGDGSCVSLVDDTGQQRFAEVKIQTKDVCSSEEYPKLGNTDQSSQREEGQSSLRTRRRRKPCVYGRNCCLGKKCKYSHPEQAQNSKKPSKSGPVGPQDTSAGKRNKSEGQLRCNAEAGGLQVTATDGSSSGCSEPCVLKKNSTEGVSSFKDKQGLDSASFHQDCQHQDAEGDVKKLQLKAEDCHELEQGTSQYKSGNHVEEPKVSSNPVKKEESAQGALLPVPSIHWTEEQKVKQHDPPLSPRKSEGSVHEGSRLVSSKFDPAGVQSSTSHSVLTGCVPANVLPHPTIYQPSSVRNLSGVPLLPPPPFCMGLPLMNPFMPVQSSMNLKQGLVQPSSTNASCVQDSNFLSCESLQPKMQVESGMNDFVHGVPCMSFSCPNTPVTTCDPTNTVPVDQVYKVKSDQFFTSSASCLPTMGQVSYVQRDMYSRSVQINSLSPMPLPPLLPFVLPGVHVGNGVNTSTVRVGVTPVYQQAYYRNTPRANACEKNASIHSLGTVKAKEATISGTMSKEWQSGNGVTTSTVPIGVTPEYQQPYYGNTPRANACDMQKNASIHSLGTVKAEEATRSATTSKEGHSGNGVNTSAVPVGVTPVYQQPYYGNTPHGNVCDTQKNASIHSLGTVKAKEAARSGTTNKEGHSGNGANTSAVPVGVTPVYQQHYYGNKPGGNVCDTQKNASIHSLGTVKAEEATRSGMTSKEGHSGNGVNTSTVPVGVTPVFQQPYYGNTPRANACDMQKNASIHSLGTVKAKEAARSGTMSKEGHSGNGANTSAVPVGVTPVYQQHYYGNKPRGNVCDTQKNASIHSLGTVKAKEAASSGTTSKEGHSGNGVNTSAVPVGVTPVYQQHYYGNKPRGNVCDTQKNASIHSLGTVKTKAATRSGTTNKEGHSGNGVNTSAVPVGVTPEYQQPYYGNKPRGSVCDTQKNASIHSLGTVKAKAATRSGTTNKEGHLGNGVNTFAVPVGVTRVVQRMYHQNKTQASECDNKTKKSSAVFSRENIKADSTSGSEERLQVESMLKRNQGQKSEGILRRPMTVPKVMQKLLGR